MNDVYLSNEAATQAFGECIAVAIAAPMIISLQGDLGTGKTCLVRAILRKLGITGSIKSPSFTLIESYDTKGFTVYHCDLYRMSDPMELEYLGLRDYAATDAIIFVEWPEHGEGYLPPPDIAIKLTEKNNGRILTLCGESQQGRRVIKGINDDWSSTLAAD